MKRTPTILLLIILCALTVGPKTILPLKATPWGTGTPLPGADQYSNTFPKLVQASNGTVWLVWEKFVTTYGEIYMMVNNGFGWSGEIPLVNSLGAFDDITPALVQLTNGTMILAWSRGSLGTGGCFGGNPNTYDIYTESFSNGRWTNPTPLVQASGDDLSPALTRLKDGRVMLVWNRCTTTNGGGDIYYKIFNGTWGPEISLVATPAEEKLPSVIQANDGRVWVIFSSNTGTGFSNVLNQVIWNGTSWTIPVQLTNAGVDDDWSSIAQDRNQTLWLFWSRNVFNGTVSGSPTYQYDLFYKNSTNNGASWSLEQTLAPNINSQDIQPSVIQTNTKKLWMVYSSDQKQGNPYHTQNLYLITSDIVKIHDLTLTSFTMPPAYPYHRVGEVVNLTATVTNIGDYSDSSQVYAYANSTLVYTGTVSVNSGQSTTVILSWNSTGGMPGNYLLNATLRPAAGQFLKSNMSLNSTYPLTFKGDVNRDGKIDILDFSTVAGHFGAVRGGPAYLPDADLNRDGKIDILDLSLCAGDFGKSLTVPDLAIQSVSVINARIGESVKVTVVVKDLGTTTETTNVNVYFGSILGGTAPVTLSPGQNVTLTFTYFPMGKPIGRYSLMATVVPLPGEISLANNSMNSTYLVTFRGDVNRDGMVNVSDLVIVGGHFGATRGSANYLADADLNNDGVINIADFSMCAGQFGSKVP